MTPLQAQHLILAGAVESIRNYEDVKFASCHRSTAGLLLLERHRNALRQTAYYRPSEFVGRPLKTSERKVFMEALRELEAEKFVEVLSDVRGRAIWLVMSDDAMVLGGEALDNLQRSPCK